MRMLRLLSLFVLLMLLLFLGVQLMWTPAEVSRGAALEPQVDAHARSTHLSAPDSDAMGGADLVRSKSLMALDENYARIRVRSQAGLPLPGAEARAHQPARWRAAAEVVQALAVSDADGIILLAAQPALPEQVCIVAQGFCPSVLDALEPAGEYEVILEPCQTLRFHAETLQGTPLDQVLISISRRVLPHADSSFYVQSRSGEIVPGLDPELSIFTAITDASGNAQIEGLFPGEYHLRGWHPQLIQINEARTGSAIVPGEKKTLRFCRLAYTAIEVVGDRILSSGFIYLPARPVVSSMRTSPFTAEWRRRLEREFPNAARDVVTLGEPPSAPLPQVQCELLLERAGLYSFTHTMQLYDGEFRVEFVTRVLKTPEEMEPRGEIEIRLRDRLQRSFELDYELTAKTPGQPFPLFVMEGRSGKTIALPACTGTLRPTRDSIPFVPVRVVEIKPGEKMLIEHSYPAALRTCDLRLKAPYPDAFRDGWVRVRASHGLSGKLRITGTEPTLRFLVPEGRVEFILDVAGFEETRVDLDVPVVEDMVDPPLSVEIELQPQS